MITLLLIAFMSANKTHYNNEPTLFNHCAKTLLENAVQTWGNNEFTPYFIH